ncbi:effector-associated constant component EACC1 [Stenotrophomonas sp. NPDC087984]
MRVVLSVSGGSGAAGDLRRWLIRDPQLRGRLGREPAAEPTAGTMGATAELLPVLLAPGGLTAALAAAVVAWLQNRRGNQTVTITRPDGTQVTVTSERVRGLTAQGAGDLAQRVADALDQGPRATGPATEPDHRPEPAPAPDDQYRNRG